MAVGECLQYVTVNLGIACGGFLGWCVGSRHHVRAGVAVAILPIALFVVLGLSTWLAWLPLPAREAPMSGGHISWRGEPVLVPLPMVYGLAFAAFTAIFWVFGRAYHIYERWPEAIPDRVYYRAVASCTATSGPLFVGLFLVSVLVPDASWLPEQADKSWLLTATASALVGWLIGWAVAAVHQRHRPGRYRGHVLPDGEVLAERRIWTGIMHAGVGLLVLLCIFRGILPGWMSLTLVHVGLCAILVRPGIGYQERVWAGAYARRNDLAVLYITGTRRRLRADAGHLFATALEDLWPSADRRRLPGPREG